MNQTPKAINKDMVDMSAAALEALDAEWKGRTIWSLEDVMNFWTGVRSRLVRQRLRPSQDLHVGTSMLPTPPLN